VTNSLLTERNTHNSIAYSREYSILWNYMVCIISVQTLTKLINCNHDSRMCFICNKWLSL